MQSLRHRSLQCHQLNRHPAQVPQDSAVQQTRSRQVVTYTPRYDQSMKQRSQGLIAWEVLVDQYEREDKPTAATQYAIQKALEDPIVFAASCNPDSLYWDQVMKAHDRDKFIEALGIELDGHEKMGNYESIPISDLPKGTKLIDMVWSMRQKTCINTQEVHKWKACLNVHGGQRTTRTRRKLLGHLCPGDDLADCLPVSDSLPPTEVAKSSTRFRHGIPPSASGDATLHAIAPGIPASRNDEKGTCTETHTQHVWAKTGRPCLE